MRKVFQSVVPIALAVMLLSAGVSPLLAADDGCKQEAIDRLSAIEKKYVSLAEAIPAAKYTWRPAEGVRSVSEVFLHVSGANYGIPRTIGTNPPASFNRQGFEQSTTDQAAIVAQLKESFAHMHKAFEAVDDPHKAVKMFGRDTTVRGALWFMLEHLSEHLGQSIAYARVNGVTPPWSEK